MNNNNQDSRRTTLEFSKEFHKKLKHLAIEKDTTITKIIEDAIEQYIVNNK